MANTYPIVIRELPSNDPVNYRFAKMATTVCNGVLVTIPNREATRDVYVATLADKDTGGIASAELWMVTGVELSYEAGKMTGDYINSANKPFRIERIAAGGIYAVSLDGLGIALGQTVALGDAVCVGDNGVMNVVAAASVSDERVVGWVVNLFERGGINFAAIRFIPAGGDGSGGGESFGLVVPYYSYDETTNEMKCNMSFDDVMSAVINGTCVSASAMFNGQDAPTYLQLSNYNNAEPDYRGVLFSSIRAAIGQSKVFYLMLYHSQQSGIQISEANWALT